MDDQPRRRGKGWTVAAGVLGAVIVGVAVCEWAGWPFLAKPVEGMLSKTLLRDVQLNEAGSSEHATVRFLGGLKVKVPQLQIGAPEWSKQPYFLHAEHAEMHVAYSDLWRARQGQPLDIDLLQAERLVVHAERMMDGRASWAFGDPNKPKPADEAATPIPTVRELRVLRGDMTYVDQPLKADIVAKLQLSEGGAAGDAAAPTASGRPASTPSASKPLPQAFRGLIASAEGTYGLAKLSADLRTSGVTPLLKSDADAVAVPVTLSVRSGKAALDFKGTVTDIFNLSNMIGMFKVSGPSLAAAGDPLGVTLPTTGAFLLAGRISKKGDVWNVVTDNATVGQSSLKAALTYDMRPKVPLLSGQVTGPRLLLADLAPTIGGEPGAAPAPPATGASAPPRNARVIPDSEFDLPSLRAMNANVLMSFDRVELGSLFALPLQPLKTHLTLQDGKLRLDDLVARTADGNVAGRVSLDGTGEVALYETDLRWSGVKLENWIKQERGKDTPPYVKGSLVGRAQLKGQGRSTAQILGTLNGSVITSLRRGELSHLAIEAAGIDLAQLLGVFVKGDQGLPVSCALADMQVNQGVLKPRAFVVDTGDSTVWVDGTVSLKDEVLDLRAVTTPKDFSPLALRTPIRVQGQFAAPKVSLETAPLARKVAGAVLLGLINPLAAVIPFVELGNGEVDRDDGNCDTLLKRAREASRAVDEGDAQRAEQPGAPKTVAKKS